VSPIELPASPIAGLRAVELARGDEPLLQRFFEANPFYFLAVNGEPALPEEADEEIHGQVPADMSFTKKWVIGYVDAKGDVIALANVISDLLAGGVWHIGTFIVATARQGHGDAQALYRSVEDWCGANGTRWMRLNVVQGHERAERFWGRRGYAQTTERVGIAMGKRMNTLRVMVKPLADNTLEQYLTLMPRDRSEYAGE
jgi:GNAT superfamily N-acetyltransferase